MPSAFVQAQVKQRRAGGDLKYGHINSMDGELANLRMNAIPESIFEMELPDSENFLAQRQRLMAIKIRDFYFSL